MPSPTTLLTVALAAVALLLVPGPSVLFVVARSLEHGRRAGLASVAGGAVGNLAHVAAAALGLSAILASSAIAFSVVKYAGAAYLIYLGLQTLLKREPTTVAPVGPARSLPRIFVQAVTVYTLNPKTALFFLAFLPQFVDPGRGAIALQILVLGGVFVLLALITDGAYALISGSLAGWLRASARARRLQRWCSGGVYLGLGAATALGANPK